MFSHTKGALLPNFLASDIHRSTSWRRKEKQSILGLDCTLLISKFSVSYGININIACTDTDCSFLEEFEGKPRDYNPYLCEMGPDGPCEGSQPDEHHVLEWERWKILKRIPEPPPHVYSVPDSDDETKTCRTRQRSQGRRCKGKRRRGILGGIPE